MADQPDTCSQPFIETVIGDSRRDRLVKGFAGRALAARFLTAV
jgi:hypothetical protein